jgi:long-subunit fatty acid transport protein
MNKLILAVTIVVPQAAVAGGYFIPNETARDLALSESAVADQHGAEAVFLNVGALAGQQDLDVSANGELLVLDSNWSDPSLGNSSLVSQPNYPPAGAVSYGGMLPNGMAWGAGVGALVSGGSSLTWPNAWQGQEAVQSVSQQVFQYGAGAALQPLPFLKVGASVLRYRTIEDLHQSINFLDHYADAHLGMSGDATSFGLGVEVAVPDTPLTLAATYKHSADMTLDGNVHFTDVPMQFQPMVHDQGVTQKVTIPSDTYVGAAYRFTPDVTAMFAVNYERWDVYKSDTFVGTDGFMVSVPRDYNNAYAFRGGVEWRRTPFLRALTLRGSAMRSVSDQPSDTLSPSLTDASSTVIGVGAGYHLGRELRIDLGYQHAFFDTVTATGDAFPGTYKTRADLLSLGLNWRTDWGFLRGR